VGQAAALGGEHDGKKLPLAMGIADAVSDAQRRNSSLDVEAKTDQLLNDHPEAEASRAVIEKTLREESADAGVRPKRPNSGTG
jgi:hypothetical protein